MRLEGLDSSRAERRATSRAIHAVECQALKERDLQSLQARKHQQQFFALLDSLSEQIFAGITAEAERNARVFYLTRLPGFRSQCDLIFGKGFGDFPIDMMNLWLISRDLKHLFHFDGNGLTW